MKRSSSRIVLKKALPAVLVAFVVAFTSAPVFALGDISEGGGDDLGADQILYAQESESLADVQGDPSTENGLSDNIEDNLSETDSGSTSDSEDAISSSAADAFGDLLDDDAVSLENLKDKNLIASLALGKEVTAGAGGDYNDLGTAIYAANTTSGGDPWTIVMLQDYTLGKYYMQVDSGINLTIKSKDGEQYSIRERTGGMETTWMVNVYGNLTLENVTIVGTNTKLVVIDGSLTIQPGAVIEGGGGSGIAGDYGYGVDLKPGNLIMNGGEISNNLNSGVRLAASSLTMNNGEISNNNTKNGGGGVLLDDGSSLIMYGGVISNNTASYGGGVGYYNHTLKDSSLIMYGGEISNNTADMGGGVSLGRGSLTMHDGEIISNTAINGNGGGAYSEGNINMFGGKISDNTANHGGGMCFSPLNDSGEINVSGGEISNNTAKYYGGGMYFYGNVEGNMSGGKISDNTALYGGGIYQSNTGNIKTLNNVIFSGNKAQILNDPANSTPIPDSNVISITPDIAAWQLNKEKYVFNNYDINGGSPAYYRVTYVHNNGSTSDKDAYAPIGGKLADNYKPSYAGHVFAGWYIDEDLETEYTFDVAIGGDITLYAKWQEIQYNNLTAAAFTIKEGDINALYGSKGDSPAEYLAELIQRAQVASDVTITNAVIGNVPGGEFAAGSTHPVTFTDAGGDTVIVRMTVIGDEDAGGDSKSPEDGDGTTGTAISAHGYTIKLSEYEDNYNNDSIKANTGVNAWYWDNDNANTGAYSLSDVAVDKTKMPEAATIGAFELTLSTQEADGGASVSVWVNVINDPLVVHTVTYRGNGHTSGVAPSQTSHNHGSNAMVKGSETLVRTNYSFLGWSTNPEATSASYTAGQTIPVMQDIVLHAVWKEDEVESGIETVPVLPTTPGTTEDVIDTAHIADDARHDGGCNRDADGYRRGDRQRNCRCAGTRGEWHRYDRYRYADRALARRSKGL